eukprot:s11156_g1.t1
MTRTVREVYLKAVVARKFPEGGVVTRCETAVLAADGWQEGARLRVQRGFFRQVALFSAPLETDGGGLGLQRGEPQSKIHRRLASKSAASDVDVSDRETVTSTDSLELKTPKGPYHPPHLPDCL